MRILGQLTAWKEELNIHVSGGTRTRTLLSSRKPWPAQAAVPTQENLGPAQICQPWLRLWLLEYWCGHWRPAFRSRTIRREEYPKVYILEAGPGLCFTNVILSACVKDELKEGRHKMHGNKLGGP